jgi:hypothetical protein
MYNILWKKSKLFYRLQILFGTQKYQQSNSIDNDFFALVVNSVKSNFNTYFC